ncbi:MAG: hypothetical protein D3926_18775 [Desulfobacteraceae bacterium]|nr:MAG: hypothetical protein D3926_18775 [Desulfobacteraceae bacterium]
MKEIDSKIQSPATPRAPAKHPGQQNHPQADQPSFEDMLHRKIQGNASPPDAHRTTVTGTSTLPEIEAPLVFTSEDALPDPGIIALKADQALEKLDTYTRWLNNPEKNLKQLSRLLDDVEQASSGIRSELADILDRNAAPPAGLTRILDEMETLVSKEKIKILRGDYL